MTLARSARLAFLGAVLVTITTAYGKAEPPPNFRAYYSAHAGSVRVAESVVVLEHNGSQRFTYRSVTKPVGLLAVFRSDEVTEHSVWTLHRDRIRPLEYRYIHKRSKKDRDVFLDFDWSEGQVANTAEGHTWTMAIPEGTLDKFSVRLAVMMDLAAGVEPPLEYPIADGGKLKHYRFAALGTERVRTPAGEFEALKLQRLRDRDKDRETYFWCAPALDYLLVRLEHVDEDGHRYYLELDRVEGL